MAQQLPENVKDLKLTEMCATLTRLERREWWRWSVALLIMLALTLGVVLIAPYGAATNLDRATLHRAVWGLLGLVLLFDVFVFHQQIAISRLRRELANQIATVATIEALAPLSPGDESGRQERRRAPRLPLDELLKLTRPSRGKDVYGRVRDIGDNGLGAVVPEELEVGEAVTLKCDLPNAPGWTVQAVVRYRRGFHYGFEFTNLSSADCERLREAISAAVVHA
ncbi:MAG: PilZ domain-containing protein [Terriglobales bacterium]